MGEEDKPLVWLHGEVKTPPMSASSRAIVILDVLKKKTQATP